MWADRNSRGIEGSPPCDGCKIELMPENAEAIGIFQIVRRQLLVSGMGQPIDINHIAIHEAMRLYDVEDKKTCFNKVIKLGSWLIAKLNKKED